MVDILFLRTDMITCIAKNRFNDQVNADVLWTVVLKHLNGTEHSGEVEEGNNFLNLTAVNTVKYECDNQV